MLFIKNKIKQGISIVLLSLMALQLFFIGYIFLNI